MADALSPREIDALLRPDLRTVAADLYALSRDLERMCDTLHGLASTMASLQAVTARVAEGRGDTAVRTPPAAPRAD